MKTPDEIKKGMECCVKGNCMECPYEPLYKTLKCKAERCRDEMNYIQQLEAKVPKWISVEERLPEHDVFVLVGYNRYDLAFEGCYLEDEKYWCDREYSYIAPPSHWMPLPEPPKEATHDQ